MTGQVSLSTLAMGEAQILMGVGCRQILLFLGSNYFLTLFFPSYQFSLAFTFQSVLLHIDYKTTSNPFLDQRITQCTLELDHTVTQNSY